MAKKEEARNIGVDVKAPTERCSDRNCPFHGTLPVRGQIITGIVSSAKMQGSVLVKREHMHYVQKYERYEKRRSSVKAHNPSCINATEGNIVRIKETRPISKTKKFTVIEIIDKK